MVSRVKSLVILYYGMLASVRCSGTKVTEAIGNYDRKVIMLSLGRLSIGKVRTIGSTGMNTMAECVEPPGLLTAVVKLVTKVS